MTGRALLLILDGFGIGKDSPFNAISNAKMPFYRQLLKRYPHSELLTHGAAVGLPDGIMGNSEVGHMTMGAGRIIYQDLVRVNRAIEDKTFFKNRILIETLKAGASQTGRVHLMGLLSDAGVHSAIDHLFALLELCAREGVPQTIVHPILDGRDTPPDSSFGYLARLLAHPMFSSKRAFIGTLGGRYFAMDRDKRWERIDRALAALFGRIPVTKTKGTDHSALVASRTSHEKGKTDEFMEPILLDVKGTIEPGDSFVFFNFRADRARQITQKLVESGTLSKIAGMTVYDEKTPIPAAFEPQKLSHNLGECLENRGLKQFRIAETEKYAHVTFFFNGGRELPFKGEDRILIESLRDVPTYDLKPEMSAFAVASEAVKRIESGQYDFMLMNFANADMVGHTGNYEAAVKAMEALDQCLERVIGAAERHGMHTLLTADHGNAEEMQDEQGKPHTQHTLNPVPALSIAPGTANGPERAIARLRDGGLSDIMPTLCEILELKIPPEVTGKSLIPKR